MPTEPGHPATARMLLSNLGGFADRPQLSDGYHRHDVVPSLLDVLHGRSSGPDARGGAGTVRGRRRVGPRSRLRCRPVRGGRSPDARGPLRAARDPGGL